MTVALTVGVYLLVLVGLINYGALWRLVEVQSRIAALVQRQVEDREEA